MASQNFTNLADSLAEGGINYRTATFKALLINTTVPTETELDTWVDRADVGNENASGDYTAGGFDVTCTVDAVVDTVNNNIDITFAPTSANPQYTSSTISSNGAYIYLSTGVAANDKLISFVDFGSTVSSSNGDFNVTFSTPLVINV